MKGLAPDGGLYMPKHLPSVSRDELESFREKKYSEIASQVLGKFLHEEADRDDISGICNEIYDFGVPIETVDGRFNIMRLDRGRLLHSKILPPCS